MKIKYKNLTAILTLFAFTVTQTALAVPGFVKARKQSQGRRVLNDARQMDAAIDQWALETGQVDGATVDTTASATYLKSAWKSNDILSNPYTIGSVGTNQVKIAGSTKTALAGVGIDWGPY